MKEKDFTQIVRDKLEVLGLDLVQVLEKLINYDYPKELAYLSFEVFPDGFTEGFPIQTFFLDSDFTEYFIMDGTYAKYPSPVDPCLLEIDYVYPIELEEEFSEFIDENKLWEIATKELITWFIKCWKNAGGKNFHLKASIIAYDGEYDLIEEKYIS